MACKHLRLIPLLIILTISLSAGVFADSAAVKQQIDSILDRDIFSRGWHACVIKNLDTGEIVYSRNPQKLLMTASNMKLMTAAAALDRLGPEFTYTTRLLAGKRIGPEGVLDGDIIIQGSGDPLLDATAYAAMIEEAKQKGLRQINGSIIADTGNFDRSPYGWGWSWDYLSAGYAAPVGGLNYNKNVMAIMVEPAGEPGRPAAVYLEPGGGHMRISSSVLTGQPGSNKTINRQRDLGGTSVTVSGTIPVDASTIGPESTVAVLNPALFAADSLKQMLQNNGIPVSGRTRLGTPPPDSVLLSEHTSVPLSQVLIRLNKWSDNLVAESLVRTIGSVRRGNGSFTSGRAEAYDFFRNDAGIDLDGVSMADGSGLSRLNMVSAESFVQLLDHMRTHRYSQYFIDSLPIAGMDGTLQSRMRNTPAQGNVRGKTGYIGSVSGLSGYVTTGAGEELAYSILFNHQTETIAPCREAQDEICAFLAGISEPL